MLASGELRLLLAMLAVLVTGVGVGVVLDHFGDPTVVYVHKIAPNCSLVPLVSPDALVEERTRPELRQPPRPPPSEEEASRVASERASHVLVGHIARGAMQVLPRVVFVATGTGEAALGLARMASHRCTLLAIDSEDHRTSSLIEEWASMRRLAAAVFSPLSGSPDRLLDVVTGNGSQAGRSPVLVVLNWEYVGDFDQGEFLREVAPRLPDGSVVIVDRGHWQTLAETVAIDSLNVNGVPTSLAVDDRWAALALGLGAGVVAVRITRFPPGISFDRSLLPPWGGMEQVVLKEPEEFKRNDWIAFARVQKTASKSLEGFIHSHIPHTRCDRRFAVSPPYDFQFCRSNEVCSPGVVSSMVEGQVGFCHLFSSQHCDWDDLQAGLFESNIAYRLITAVREPISRVRSEFKHTHGSYIKAWDYCPSAAGSAGDKFGRETFINFLNNTQNGWGMVNRQARMLAGCGTKARCTLSETELYERAALHLLQVDTFSIAGRFAEAILLAAYEFKWDFEPFRIVSDGRSASLLDWDVDDEVQALIIAVNGADEALFEFASALMDARISQLQARTGIDEVPTLTCSEDLCQFDRPVSFAS